MQRAFARRIVFLLMICLVAFVAACKHNKPISKTRPLSPPASDPVATDIATDIACGIATDTATEIETPQLASKPATPTEPRPGTLLLRTGDEIMACGQLFHTGTPVVLWTDPGGYDAYRTERRFAPWDVADFESTAKELPQDFSQPNRYGVRKGQLDADIFERIRGGGWDLPTLQNAVDQFVLHYDACGTSRQCFNILHDHRALSVHFMLDLDGTIYQTLDLKERAWHATSSNSRSIGVEIANIGAYSPEEKGATLDQWYRKDPDGLTRVVLPAFLARNSGVRTPDFVARPMRNQPVVGTIQGKSYRMYDLTPEQYQALIKLTATLCTVFPKINCDAPRDGNHEVTTTLLPPEKLSKYQGILGHFHIQDTKQDPGPAVQWDRVILGAQAMMSQEAKQANREAMGHPALSVTTAPATQPSTTAPTTNPTTAPTTGITTQAVTPSTAAATTNPVTLPTTRPATTEPVAGPNSAQ